MKPVFFLALANDRQVDSRYLRKLKEERFAIEKALHEAKDYCETVVVPDASIEDIFRLFHDERYRGRIVAFHYAGHANGQVLEMESLSGGNESANAEGLANFLGQQEGLKLVFLNGCATSGHVEHLQSAGVENIIYTSKKIRDDVATDFASRFYRAIACHKSLKQAIAMAEAEIDTRVGGDTRSLWFAGVDNQEENGNQTHPWESVIPADTILLQGTEKGPVKAFIVYAAEDEAAKNQLGKHLTMLRRVRLIDTWDSGDIKAGGESQAEIKQKLSESRIVLLLVSADYLGSDTCFEMEEAVMEQHRLRNVRVIPILLKDCLYEELPFSKFQALPRNRQPILGSHWPSEDEAYVEVAVGLKQLCESLK